MVKRFLVSLWCWIFLAIGFVVRIAVMSFAAGAVLANEYIEKL